MSPGRVEVASRLDAPAPAVWDRISSFEGVNDELMPLMRMTAPPDVRRLEPEQVVLGERICRSWVLLFGFLPFDYDDLVLVELEPGRGFHERSTMLSMRSWEHERWIDPDGEHACTLHDRLTFTPAAAAPAGTRRAGGLPPPPQAPPQALRRRPARI